MTKSRWSLSSAAAIVAALLAACASTPETRFHTLLRPAPPPPAAAPAAAFAIEILPVSVPEQVDVPQLVVRRSNGELSLVESRHWAAPLGRELRAALADRLTRELGARDVYRLAVVPGMQVWRVKVDVTRFDAELGRYALVDAAWSISGDGKGAALTCTTDARESVGADYEALVEGYQRAVMRLADQIAAGLRQAGRGGGPGCPS